MVLVSFWLGKKYYPIPYDVPKIVLNISIFLGLWVLSMVLETGNDYIDYTLKTSLLIAYIIWNVWKEGLLKRLNFGS